MEKLSKLRSFDRK